MTAIYVVIQTDLYSHVNVLGLNTTLDGAKQRAASMEPLKVFLWKGTLTSSYRTRITSEEDNPEFSYEITVYEPDAPTGETYRPS